MAAVAELSFLLFALINYIHAEERILIRRERGSYTFDLPKDANSCLISRFVGEEKLVLWNTSDLWSQNSTLPEDLKQRLSVVSRENIFYYMIDNLTYSDSGLYQEECWTDGKVTHEENISIIICSTIGKVMPISVTLGGTVYLPCFEEDENLDFQWLKREFGYEQEIWTRVFGDSMTSVMDHVEGKYHVEKNASALRVSNTTTVFTVYTCLVMSQQQCVSSRPVRYDVDTEMIYHSVEETAVLPCTGADFTDEQPPLWKKENFFSNTDKGQENNTLNQNHSLVFSSLMLNHTGLYYCETSKRMQTYFLVVCPKFGPPAVELFPEGEEVTLRCNDWDKGRGHFWFIKSNRREGRLFNTITMSITILSRLSLYPSNGSLVISNVSLKDAGEYWRAVLDSDDRCVSTTKTLLLYREPFGVYSTFYKVRCSVLSGLLVMLCVVVVAVNQWTRRGEQLHPDP